MSSRRFSLTFAIVSSLACLLLLTWILLSLISFKTAEQDLRTQKIEESRLLAATVAASFPVPFTPEGVAATMARLALHLSPGQGVLDVAVVDKDRQMLLGGPLDTPLRAILKGGDGRYHFSHGGRQLHRYAPIRQQGELVGAIRISVSLGAEYERLQRSRTLITAYFVLDFILLLFIGSGLITRVVVTPIRKLLTVTERVAAGDLTHSVPVQGSAEIAALAESFNSMVAALRHKREEVDRHVASLEQVNRDLQAAREETVRSEKMASVGVLAAGMAHEIGTPLASILGYAEILHDELGGEGDQADCLRRIEQEARRIDRLVRELLDFARPTQPEREWLNVRAFLADTLAMLVRQGALKNIATELTAPDDLPPLFIDRNQLLQVLLNLLLNARDAMPNGGNLRLAAECTEFSAEEAWGVNPAGAAMGRRREDFGGVFSRAFPGEADAVVKCIRITMADTGSGIAPDQLTRIFDPFFSSKEPGKGTGLGLAIAARFVDSFGGRITVSSELGCGTTFMLWLPVLPGAEETI
jgi:signal transduction histidine kinase